MASTCLPHRDRGSIGFFVFICASMACRSFEAGVVSSMMPAIKESLDFDYANQGLLAAAPDYGIVPGGIAAIFALEYFGSFRVLTVALFGTALATLVCVVMPSKESLMLARALGGFLWAPAATLYPVWIDQSGAHAERRTMWLGLMNICLLVGVIVGYIIGGMALASRQDSVTWVELYFLEACLMLACGAVLISFFDRGLVQINKCRITENREQEKPDDGESSTSVEPIHTTINRCSSTSKSASLRELLSMLSQSTPYVLSVTVLALVAGCTCFALYFITQVCLERGFDEVETVLDVALVFTTAPTSGMLVGAVITAKLGGYSDHVVTFRSTLVSSLGTLVAAALMSLSSSSSLSGNAIVDKALFVLACWLFFFSGATPTAALNGVVVSAVPEASHVASGLQFALINSAKLVVPPFGGVVVDTAGLIAGFHATMIACSVAFCAFAFLGLRRADRNGSHGYEEVP